MNYIPLYVQERHRYGKRCKLKECLVDSAWFHQTPWRHQPYIRRLYNLKGLTAPTVPIFVHSCSYFAHNFVPECSYFHTHLVKRGGPDTCAEHSCNYLCKGQLSA